MSGPRVWRGESAMERGEAHREYDEHCGEPRMLTREEREEADPDYYREADE